jgi:hypothetical protein
MLVRLGSDLRGSGRFGLSAGTPSGHHPRPGAPGRSRTTNRSDGAGDTGQVHSHPRRPASNQWLGGAGSGHHPPGMLEASLRPLPGLEADRAAARADDLSQVLQRGASSPRPPHQGPHSALGSHPGSWTPTCVTSPSLRISGTGQSSWATALSIPHWPDEVTRSIAILKIPNDVRRW